LRSCLAISDTPERRLVSNGFWRCQVSFKLFDKLSDVQAIRECVMHMDGDGHGAAVSGFRDLSERNHRSRVSSRETPCMRDGSEIEPRKHGEPDQILSGVSHQIGSALYALQFSGSFSHKREKLRLIGVVSKSYGPIRATDGASAMNGGVSPYRVIDNASREVFDLMRCDQCAVNQCEEYRDARLLRETKRFGAIDPQADPMKGFVELAEEMEKGATLPGLQINRNGTGTVLLGHHFIVYAPKQRCGGIVPVRSPIT